MREKRAVAGLIIAVALLALILGGCGGSRHVAAPTAAARFVGRATCAGCHSGIDADFSLQAHGLDFLTAHGDQIYGYGGRCAPCHTVGYDEPSGFDPNGSTPYLESIGCEECHGPGGDHASNPSSSNINRVPIAEETCWDCHVSSYKEVRGPVPTVTDASLYEKAPGSITIHHPQTLFLLGEYGYEHLSDPGPHALVNNTCVSCHLNPVESATTLGLRNAGHANHGDGALHPDLTTCARCHDSEQEAKSLFEGFEEEMEEQLIELGGEDPSNPGEPDADCGGGLLNSYAATHNIDLDNNSDPDNQYVKNYKGARHNYEYLLHDGSYGAHNPPFAEALLEEARQLLDN